MTADDIVAMARSMGFALAGVCEAEPSRFATEFQAWLASGKHGTMDYLARNTEIRVDPRTFLPGARSLVLVADLYADRSVRSNEHRVSAPSDAAASSPTGRIARYAQGKDYHKVMKRRLHALADAIRARHPQAECRAFVDTAPIFEREHAARAGLGWIGKHTLLIHPREGSFMLLGGIATTLDLAPPTSQQIVADHCGTCTRCIDACPTQAITPRSVDASRCIAYLTIEKRGAIDPAFHAAIGDWIFGCDICQDVCPHNSPRPREASTAIPPDYRPRERTLDALAVLDWQEEDRLRTFAGTPVMRATLPMLKRNAIIVIGNAIQQSMDARLRERCTNRLSRIAEDPAEVDVVRQTAREVLSRCSSA